jgi:ClpP class serine protease
VAVDPVSAERQSFDTRPWGNRKFPNLGTVNTAFRSALILPGLLAAAPLVPTSFGVADPDGILSLQTNPAGLARMGGTELGVESGAGQIQSQDAIEGGWRGLGVGWDRFPGPVDPSVRESDLRLGWGLDLGRNLYAGLTGVRHEVDGTSTGWSADLGLLWQPSEYLSLGWLMPNLQGEDASRSTGSALGFSIRPTATLDLQVGMEAWLDGAAWIRPSWDNPTWEATARVRPLPWLALDGRVDPEHPGRWGFGVSAQATPDLSFFSRSAPAPGGTQFQTFGVHWIRQTRPSLGVLSPVLVYHLPSSLDESLSWGCVGGMGKVRDDFRQIEGLEGLSTVVLDMGSTRLSPSTAGELRRQVLDLRAHGIKVYAWSHDLDMGNIYVLSAADRAAIDPDGTVRAHGLALDQLYFGKILRRHGVEVQVVKTGPWKSAMEPFESDRMSEAAREDAQRLLMDLDSSILAGVVAGRRVDPSALVAFMDTGSLSASIRGFGTSGGYPPGGVGSRQVGPGAPQRGVVDAPGGSPARDLGRRQEGGSRAAGGTDRRPRRGNRDGSLGEGLAADRAMELLDRLGADPSVGAVVLRVNSPGGSVAGSERLRRAVERLAAIKPVAASFGATAASGPTSCRFRRDASSPSRRAWWVPSAHSRPRHRCRGCWIRSGSPWRG